MLPGQHPLILLPGVSYAELRALLDYMYYGEVLLELERLGLRSQESHNSI